MGLRAWIYDRALLPLTTSWYREVLDRMPQGSRLLDIGIGTGGALANNASVVRDKELNVVGIDIDADYVRRARERLHQAGLSDLVTVELESVYDFVEDGFDGAYFSASFMILPDPVRALRHVSEQLGPHGRIFFTQTFHDRKSPVMEKVKPLLKTITTVEFGKVTYEEDFLATLAEAGVEVVEHRTLESKRNASYRLVVGQPITSEAAK